MSIVMTGFASIETAINATKKGVYHYLTKPFELDVLLELVQRGYLEKFKIDGQQLIRQDKPNQADDKNTESTKLSSYVYTDNFKIEAPTAEDTSFGMIGRSKKMKQVFARIKKVASSASTVLITGPSGTGKELVARAIHDLSFRASKRMVSVNCGAIPAELLESELFGHMRGAFTGAISDKKGRFEQADRSSIFLDEIGDMPMALQVKILRVLQNREVEPVGHTETKAVDVRIIAATHRNLEKEITEGNFREDLFYRLNVIPISIPPLLERREDIPLLISYFLSKFVSADGRNNLDFNSEALELLMGYDWPGNVRELENLIERLVILKGGSVISSGDLPAKFFRNRMPFDCYKQLVELPDNGIDLKNILSEIEDSLILQALDKTKGNKNRASKLLYLNRTTLIEKMKKKGLSFQ
ncbi:MAG: sigma-54-dependent Fis family transcriptional regulator [Bacteriovoracaceae bacterium]|nr:sigma-54-dependent Fis family transcriptional regulator [Bacteriovoracaceae bacterium]